MLNFLQKLKNFAIKSLIIGCIALVVTIALGTVLLPLDGVLVFRWFLEVFILYFAILFLVGLVGFISWYMTPSAVVLVGGIGVVLLAIYVFATLLNPIMTFAEFKEFLKTNEMESFLDLLRKVDDFFKFLKKAPAEVAAMLK